MANNDIFSMINNFFKPKEWSEYTNYDKSKSYFMINRYLSIKYPIQAAMLSWNNIKGDKVVEFWRRVVSRNFKTLPDWFFTKTKNVSTKEKDIFVEFDGEVIDLFYKMNECSYKELDELKKRFPNETYEELKKIDKMSNSYQKTKKLKK